MSASAKPSTPASVKSEDILSAKTDLCLSNAIVKAGTGLAVGVVASAILFRRRPWPVLLGLGFGFGQGYADCERVFSPASLPGYRIAGQDKVRFTLSSSLYRTATSASLSKPCPDPVVGRTRSPPQTASPFTLSERTSSAPAAQQAAAKVDEAKHDAKSKVAELVQQAKHKAAEARDKVEDKAVEVKDKVVQTEKKAEAKVDDLKDGKKWV
ncbi:hypothetical protein JCM10212_001091 [Sporobolomyces blumeae]